MSVFKWKRSYVRKQNTVLIDILIKECLTVEYDITSLEKPCWLVFRHIETKSYCCLGHVPEGAVSVGDLLPKETKTLVRSYQEWDEIIVRYIDGEELSYIEQECAKKILNNPLEKGDDLEWYHLRKYWNNLKEIS